MTPPPHNGGVPWKRKTPAERHRDARVYGDPEYQRNRREVIRQANGRCQQCGRRARLQCDHIIPITQGGTHHVDNLMALCSGPGSCHARKTAGEGGGYRARQPADPPHQPRTKW